MAAKSSNEKSLVLQRMGFSYEDRRRYIDMDVKLESFCRANESFKMKYLPQMEKADPVTAAPAAPLATEGIVEELMARGFLPMKAAVDEMKVFVVRELEEERKLLRDHFASMKKVINAQLGAIRQGVDFQLEQFGVLQQQSSQQLTEDIRDKKTESRQRPLPQKLHDRQTHPVVSEGRYTVSPQHQASEQRAEALDDGDGSPTKAGGATGQAFDLSQELLWFKEQVKLLQDELTQCRQELRRQEQQLLLQHKVSVSRQELQDELLKTKDEIVNSVKALLSFTEVEFLDSSKLLHEETKDALRKVVFENQELVQIAVRETKEIASAILSKHLKSTIQEPLCEMKEIQERNNRQVTETICSMDYLHLMTTFLIQRLIDKRKLPYVERQCIFSLYVKDFQALVGSGRIVLSLPVLFNSGRALSVLRSAAHFSNSSKEMTVLVTSALYSTEEDTTVHFPSTVQITAKIKGQTAEAQPVIEVGETTITSEDACWSTQFLQIGEPVACDRLVSEGYNGFHGNSFSIEFEALISYK